MNPTSKLRERLSQGGWVLDRQSKHKIYKHPNGATFPLPHNVSNKGHELENYMQQIKQREKGGVKVNQLVTPEVARILKPVDAIVPAARSRIVVTWYDWIKDCRKTGKFTQKEMETYFGLSQGMWCQIEQGKRRLSQEEYGNFLEYFHDCPLPEGLVIPIANTKRRVHNGYHHPSVSQEPETPSITTELVNKKADPFPEPIMSTPTSTKASVDREAAVAKAIKILRSKRLTDEEIDALVRAMESQALSLIASGF